MTQAAPTRARDVPDSCGRCVHFNDLDEGAGCAIHGPRRRDQAICDTGHAFGKTQLRMPLYGRRQ